MCLIGHTIKWTAIEMSRHNNEIQLPCVVHLGISMYVHYSVIIFSLCVTIYYFLYCYYRLKWLHYSTTHKYIYKWAIIRRSHDTWKNCSNPEYFIVCFRYYMLALVITSIAQINYAVSDKRNTWLHCRHDFRLYIWEYYFESYILYDELYLIYYSINFDKKKIQSATNDDNGEKIYTLTIK